MVDGVIDIPLPGWPLESADQGGTTAAGHFVAGPENRLVEVAVHSVLAEPPESPREQFDRRLESPPTILSYNPLVLYGPSGTGKSYLARGMAAAWKARTRQSPEDRTRRVRPTLVVCTTAVDFARELAEAIETQAVEEFRAKHRGAALLVVEDLGMLATRKAGKLNAQEELIHTLDALLAEDRWVIATASAPPAELPDILPALKSRLTGGLTIPLAPPGPEARLAIIQQLAALRNLELPEPVAQVLAEGLGGTAPELAGSLLELVMPTRLRRGRLDLQRAKQYLAGRNRTRQPTLHEIALLTARHFSLRLADLRSSARRRALVTARGVAVYLARRLTDESLQEIGGYFGGRDHTTVLHSCRQTEELMKSDPTIRQSVESLQKILGKT
jgi:chromosomal replication initiator protein